LDATRCISYLTIELGNSIPHDLRPLIGDWLFGCDICQDVCPWNRRAAKKLAHSTVHPFPGPLRNSLHELLELSDEAFRERFGRTALWRARRRGLLRNAAIVLGNQGAPEAQDALARALVDREPLVRGAAAWALGRISTTQAIQTLVNCLEAERDPEVRSEIQCALEAALDASCADSGRTLKAESPKSKIRKEPE
jgi:epoxyqueuosine reductase